MLDLAFLSSPTLWRPELIGSAIVAYWDAYDGMDASATWTSRLGGITAGQSSAPARPTWSAFQRNGKPAVVYNGSSQYHDISSVAAFPATTATSFLLFVGYDASATTTSGYAFSWGNNTATHDRTLRHNNTAQKTVAVGNNGVTVASAIPWSLADKIIGWDQNATTASLYIDGVTTPETGAMVPATISTSGRMGASLATATFFNGSQCCSIVMNRSATTGERQQLEGWVAWRFALTGLLPASHPYKNQAPTASAIEVERFLDDIRDTRFTTDYHREATRRLYTPVRRLIRPDQGWKLAA